MTKKRFTLLFLFFAVKTFAQLTTPETAEIPHEAIDYFVTPVQSDRPAFTMNANTLYKNSWLIQAGTGIGRLIDYGSVQEFNTYTLPIDVRYGITNRLEAMVTADMHFASGISAASERSYGLQGYGIGARYNIFNHGLHEALKGKNFGSMAVFAMYQQQFIQPRNVSSGVLITKILYRIDLTDYLTIASNIGFNFADEAWIIGNAFQYTLNVSTPISKHFSAFVENYGTGNNINGFNLGFAWWAAPNIQLDFFAGRGNIANFGQLYLAGGFSYRFGKAYR